jgi:hypothetical protein
LESTKDFFAQDDFFAGIHELFQVGQEDHSLVNGAEIS